MTYNRPVRLSVQLFAWFPADGRLISEQDIMSRTDPKLGRTVIGTEYRDAVHIAIAPVTSDETLQPGQHVGLLKNRTDKAAVVLFVPLLTIPAP